MQRFQVPDEIAIRVPPADMHAAVAAIFGTLGCPPDDRLHCADALLYADLRGIDSHGVSNMMPTYVGMLKQGYVNPAPSLRVLREADATATVDCDRGLGLTIGPQCMDLALDKAERCGIGSVVATNGRHFGAAAYHAVRALEREMIGVALTVERGLCQLDAWNLSHNHPLRNTSQHFATLPNASQHFVPARTT